MVFIQIQKIKTRPKLFEQGNRKSCCLKCCNMFHVVICLHNHRNCPPAALSSTNHLDTEVIQ